jgi:hypothetical protein
MDSSQSAPLNHQRPEGDVAPVVSKGLPTAEEARSGEPAHDPDADRDSSDKCIAMAARLPAVQPFPLVPKELPTAEETRSGEPAPDPDARRDSPDQRIGMAQGVSDFSGELRAVKPSIRVPARASGLNDQFASDRPSIGRRMFRSFAHFVIVALIAVLIGAAASSAWQSTVTKQRRWSGPGPRRLAGCHPPGSPPVTQQEDGQDLAVVARLVVIRLDDEVAPDFAIAAKQTGPTPAGRCPRRMPPFRTQRLSLRNQRPPA